MGQGMAAVAQVAVWVVFYDGQTVPTEHRDQLFALLQRKSCALRVLEVRYQVEQLGLVGLQQSLEGSHIHAVGIRGHGEETHAQRPPGGQQGQIGGILDHDLVAGIEQHAADKLQGLLCAAGDEHVLPLNGEVRAGEAAGHPITEARQAFGLLCMQSMASEAFQHRLCCFLNPVDRKKFRCGKAAGEGNHFRLRSEFEQFADGVAPHVPGSLREQGVPIHGHLASWLGERRTANTSLFEGRCRFGMVRPMELRHLRYFVGVAEELNFTKAARKLRVAQPALSRQVRQLEDELGVKLLERTPHGVRLTESGRAFRVEAAALLRQSARAVQAAQRTGKLAGGELNVAYIWGLFHASVPPVLERFRQRSPGTAVHLFDWPPLAQAEALREERIDVGFIGFADEADAAGLNKRKVGGCAFVAALPQGHPATGTRRVSLASLAEDFFLGISDATYPGASRHVMNACARAGFRPKVLQMVERGFTILGMVSAGCGVALVPESLDALPHPGVVFRPLTEPPEANLFVAWSKASPLAEELLRCVGKP